MESVGVISKVERTAVRRSLHRMVRWWTVETVDGAEWRIHSFAVLLIVGIGGGFFSRRLNKKMIAMAITGGPPNTSKMIAIMIKSGPSSIVIGLTI
jgi:uncharacterized protein YneF (UPF0154 family)